MADKIAVGKTTSTDMMFKARLIVVDYFNKHVDVTDKRTITHDDVFVVWFSKTLQNWKALVSTTVSDGMYYEVTYNGNTGDTYVDAYKKWENFTVSNDEFKNIVKDYTLIPA